MAEVGLLHPVVVTPDGTLIAGERRLRAAQSLGWTEIAATVVDLEDIRRGEFAENVIRKDFLPSEAVAIAEALTPAEREKARGRQEESRANRGENFTPRNDSGKTLDKVAVVAGISRPTLTKAQAVVHAARAEPERFSPLVEEMDRTGRVNGVFKKLRTAQTAEAIRAEPAPLPTGPFRVIVADPPWQYDARAQDAGHRAANPYPSMSIDAICAMPVAPLGMDDSVLWLWTTNAHLPESFRVVDAWGYRYKTLLTWVKSQMGMGDWLRGKTEHCLMCVRGRPTVQLTNQTTCLVAPSAEHSAKPIEFYAMIDALCPGSKLEMFARSEREGYQRWGAEAPR